MLKSSKIGKSIMLLYRHPKETRKNREKAGKIIREFINFTFISLSDTSSSLFSSYGSICFCQITGPALSLVLLPTSRLLAEMNERRETTPTCHKQLGDDLGKQMKGKRCGREGGE